MTCKSLKFFATLMVLGGCLQLSGCAGIQKSAQIDDVNRHTPEDVVAKHGMVAAAHPLASAAGLEILKKGGNAIDAAIATGFAIGVVEPNASGLAGTGFMVIHTKDGDDVAIDFRGMAPAFITPDYKKKYLSKGMPGRNSATSVLVPGVVAGYEEAHKRYGNLPMAEIVKPAIRLAEDGFPCSAALSKLINDNFDWFLMNNAEEDVPFLNDGLPVMEGELIKQPKLAKAFRLIAEKGAYDAFYNGPIGESMVKRLNELGNKMTMDDMRSYKAAMREPVKGSYRGYQVVSMPPTSTGGLTAIETLNILENYPLSMWEHNSTNHLHHLMEATRIAFTDRNKFLADPDFTEIPNDMLLSKKYAKQRANEINPALANDKFEPGVVDDEHWSTTHLSVADADGNIVALTQTIVLFFGAKTFDPEYGFCYNDELISFSSSAKSANAAAQGKRPRSSMTPTMVLDQKGQAFMTLGSPGSSRIINALVQIISNVVDFDMSMDEAIEAARMAGTNKNKIYLEGHIPNVEIKSQILSVMGYKTEVRDPYNLYFGGAQGIMFKGGKLYGGADSRRDGIALGY
jgi:gamma-glutamyltranspeptidase / glutathione hydrolase